MGRKLAFDSVSVYSLVWDIGVGGTFWVWACINTAQRGFDAGVVTFFLAIIAGILGVGKSKRYLIALVFSYLAVALNYFGGAALASKTKSKMGESGYRLYCIVAGIVWLVTCFAFWRLHKRARGVWEDI